MKRMLTAPSTSLRASRFQGGPAAVQIEGGDYLVFNGQGQMPQMVLEVWQAIWQYFEQHPHIRRRYCTDFEAYSGPEEVAIHIGVLLE